MKKKCWCLHKTKKIAECCALERKNRNGSSPINGDKSSTFSQQRERNFLSLGHYTLIHPLKRPDFHKEESSMVAQKNIKILKILCSAS